LRLKVLGLLGFRRNVARYVSVRQCARTSGQCEVFDRNWRLPSSGRAASQLLSYFTLECTNSKSFSEESSFDTDVPAYLALLFSFQHLRFSFYANIRRVFHSQRQRRYCERSFYHDTNSFSSINSLFYFNYCISYCVQLYYKI